MFFNKKPFPNHFYSTLANKAKRIILTHTSPLMHSVTSWRNFNKTYDRPFFQFNSSKIIINKQAKPWFTYAAIELLDSILLDGLSVFEWGSGNSTKYFYARNCRTTSVEHIDAWATQLQKETPGKVIIEKEPSRYVDAINLANESYDIVLIDGEHRGDCALMFLKYLESQNCKLLIFDNSNWFPRTLRHLIEVTGWIPISLNGFGPLVNYPFQTTFLFNPEWKPTPATNYIPLGTRTWSHPDDLKL